MHSKRSLFSRLLPGVPARFLALSLLLLALSGTASSPSPLLLHLPFDRNKLGPTVGGGPATLSAPRSVQFVPGKIGRALRAGTGWTLRLPQPGRLDKRAGALCLWVRPTWDGNDGRNHIFFQDDLPFSPPGKGAFRLWQWSLGALRFDVRDAGDHYVVSRRSADWRAGEWHHIAATWDASSGTTLYVDGDALATRRFSFTPRPGKQLIFGGDGDVDDIRIYNRVLNSAQIRRVMQGLRLEPIEYLGVDGPDRVTPGRPFHVRLSVRLPQGLHGPYAFTASFLGVEAARRPLPGEFPPSTEPVQLGPFQVTVPEYLSPPSGEVELGFEIPGALETSPEKARRRVAMTPTSAPTAPRWSVTPGNGLPLRNGKPWTAGLGPDAGLLVRGEFLTDAPEDRRHAARLVRSGGLTDALRCRLIDSVRCVETSHGFSETAPTRTEELVPGRYFRLTGMQKEVTRTRKRGGRTSKVLPGFSYRLRAAPRPTPHIVVVESVNDRERYLEVAINTAPGSRPNPCLATAGTGAPDLMNLYAAYNGREYPADGRTYRLSFMVFPKTDAIEVMVTCSKNVTGSRSSAPAAVSRIWVYEMLDPLSDVPNPVVEPTSGPKRSIGLFDPEIRGMFERYGFPNSGREIRSFTVRRFMEYNRFLGFDRFEFRAFQLSEKAYFRTRRFSQAGDLDIMAELLPAMRENGMRAMPRVMYLHSYHRLFEKDPENVLQSRTGEFLRFGREGPIPDVLRPPVQRIVADSFRAICEATASWRDVVPAVCFDTSIGGVYAWRKGPASDVGYSVWDVAAFCGDTGRTLPESVKDHAGRYAWLKTNCWSEWIDWRAARWHAFILQLRDLAREHGCNFVLNPRIMPRDEWHTDRVPLKTIYKYSLFDPDRFAGTPGIQKDWFIRVNADRYFGKPWWKDWFYSPEQPALMQPSALEVYYNYWELPRHPWGFRVGPGSPIGRAFFEPYTYAMRTMNPRNMLVFCWFRGSYGHELDLREWTRAFRALPAVDPSEFNGRVSAVPEASDGRLWVKWFGSVLCVLNDSPTARRVTLDYAASAAPPSSLYDAARARAIPLQVRNGRVRLDIAVRAYDLRTFMVLAQE
ncbi:MAG: LamG domain-containing protein [Kiritimatiellaeota bacterium]|nr:LamG domain-containing protein [Kiritimatiellota bacterium]